jgi:hypothetical protein
MHTAKTTPCSQRRSLAIAPIQIISTTFIMDAMLGRYLRQIKMPRPDAYSGASTWSMAACDCSACWVIDAASTAIR